LGKKDYSVVDVSRERRALAGRINRLELVEYRAVGWFKAAPLDEIRQSAAREDVEILAQEANPVLG